MSNTTFENQLADTKKMAQSQPLRLRPLTPLAKTVIGQQVLDLLKQLSDTFHITPTLYDLDDTPIMLNQEVTIHATDHYDLIEIADALADMVYVIKGTGVQLGINVDAPYSIFELEDTRLIRKFMEAFNQPTRTQTAASRTGMHAEHFLRVRLIVEETIELLDALGLTLNTNTRLNLKKVDYDYNPEEVDYVNYDNIKHTLISLIKFCKNHAHNMFTIPLDEIIITQINPSNMSKLGEDNKPIYDEYGKVLKGKNFFEPNIAKVLTKYGIVTYPPKKTAL